MTYFKTVITLVTISAFALLGFAVKTQYDKINELDRAISAYETTVILEGIGSHADGQIESNNQEYQRRYNETNESYDSNASHLYVDFDWMF